MSDDLMGELTKMTETQAVERLGVGQLAGQLGLGNANDLISKAEGLFGGHAPQAESRHEAEENETEEKPESEEEPREQGQKPEEPTEGGNK